MRKDFLEEKNSSKKRKLKPVILIVAEGSNVTETQYFRSFQQRNMNCNIKTIIAKNITDPQGMYAELQRQWRVKGLDASKGDKGFVVLDLDLDESKAKLIEQISVKSNDIIFVPSNPCFEVWFLMHFAYSTHSFSSSAEVIKQLRNYIPNYEKVLDVSELLEDKISAATNNCNKLSKHYSSIGYKWPSAECNPMTDVYKLIEYINPDTRREFD